MKAYGKDHKNKIAVICILMLSIIYVIICSFYIHYHLTNVPYITVMIPGLGRQRYFPPLWTAYVEYGSLFLPGFLIMLAWISFSNNKKWLYAFFTAVLFANLYFLTHFRMDFWIGKDIKYNLAEYIVLLIMIILVPAIYHFWGGKKMGVFGF